MLTKYFFYRTPKRSIDGDDFDQMPSSKRMKTKNQSDFGTVCSSHDNAMSYAANSVFLNPPKVRI